MRSRLTPSGAELKPVIEGAGLNILFLRCVITFVNAPRTAPGA